MSDHSSHFDSVSGTAINLGMHSVNEKGSLHYPKVSALAREAKELQGKTSQKKEEVKEEKKTSSTEGEIIINTTIIINNCEELFGKQDLGKNALLSKTSIRKSNKGTR